MSSQAKDGANSLSASATPWVSQPTVSDLGAEEREFAVGVLARAFRDSPLNRAVIDGDAQRRLRCNLHGMRALLRSALGFAKILGISCASTRDPLAGVLLAVEPSRYPLPMPGTWQQLRCLLGQGWTVARRWALVHQAFSQVHPRDPHWYLSVLGVDPAHQGKGLGSALLGSWLAGVDLKNGSCYLETDRPENLPFYERSGFAVVHEIEVLGVRVWCMVRRAAADTGASAKR